ncbi:MAG: hypothetical protein MZW92_63535 [Comamonadaceae bacterium]|nr:hypothetical protein [Comamonadaceae bacterium]
MPARPARARRRARRRCRTRTPAQRIAAGYLKKHPHRARLRRGASKRALEPRRSLSRRIGNHVLLKREDQQPVFSFKLRGAYNKMAQPGARGAGARRDLRLGRQPRAGRGAGGAASSAAAR